MSTVSSSLGAQLRAQNATLLTKVYALMGTGLLATALMSLTTLGTKPSGPQMAAEVLVVFGLLFATMFTKGKTSGALFLMFSAVWGVLLGPMLSAYGLQPVTTAAAMTAVLFGGLTGYALVTGKDFSAWGAGLFVALLLVLAASIASLFVPAINAFVAAATLILFSLYVLYDTSQILHGKYDANEYGLAAMGLYLDVLNIFMSILQLLGKSDD